MSLARKFAERQLAIAHRSGDDKLKLRANIYILISLVAEGKLEEVKKELPGIEQKAMKYSETDRSVSVLLEILHQPCQLSKLLQLPGLVNYVKSRLQLKEQELQTTKTNVVVVASQSTGKEYFPLTDLIRSLILLFVRCLGVVIYQQS